MANLIYMFTSAHPGMMDWELDEEGSGFNLEKLLPFCAARHECSRQHESALAILTNEACVYADNVEVTLYRGQQTHLPELLMPTQEASPD